MSENHTFTVKHRWTGLRRGAGEADLNSGPIPTGVASALGGAPNRTDPEQLLLAALSSCFSITFAAICERRQIPLKEFHVQATGTLLKDDNGGLRITTIYLRPTIVLEATADDNHRQQAREMVPRAEKYCLISNAIRGNIEVGVADPEFA
jgi:peroxiredoxin-like protein